MPADVLFLFVEASFIIYVSDNPTDPGPGER